MGAEYIIREASTPIDNPSRRQRQAGGCGKTAISVEWGRRYKRGVRYGATGVKASAGKKRKIRHMRVEIAKMLTPAGHGVNTNGKEEHPEFALKNGPVGKMVKR